MSEHQGERRMSSGDWEKVEKALRFGEANDWAALAGQTAPWAEALATLHQLRAAMDEAQDDVRHAWKRVEEREAEVAALRVEMEGLAELERLAHAWVNGTLDQLRAEMERKDAVVELARQLHIESQTGGVDASWVKVRRHRYERLRQALVTP